MSPRDSFWFLTGVLVTIAIMVSTRAWLRDKPALAGRTTIPSFAVPIAAALALIGVALGIYFLLGSPQSIGLDHTATPERGAAASVANTSTSQQVAQPTTSAGSLDVVTQQLAARLAAKGGSDSEWKLLAQSYDYMGRTAEATAARAHIAAGAPSQTGNSAVEVPVGPVTSEQMAAVAQALDNTSAQTPKPTGADRGAEVSGTVNIASRFAPQAAAEVILFIYAKRPNVPGPPLAVLRLRAERWPVSFTLNDTNAMVPGRNLSSADTVQIEARISRKGDALPQPGDLVGTVSGVNPRGGRPVKISIDREIG